MNKYVSALLGWFGWGGALGDRAGKQTGAPTGSLVAGTASLHPDGSVEVADDGRGIPTDINSKTKKSGALMVFTLLHAGGKFGGGGYQAAGGLHGVGASVVNALSQRLDVQIDRDGKRHALSFNRGVPGFFKGAGPDAEFTKATDIKATGKSPRNHKGTTVRFWPDPAIFHPDAIIEADKVLARARQTAFLVPGLAICVRNLRDPKNPTEETFDFKGGVKDMVDHLSSGTPVCDTVHFTGTGKFTETVPVLTG